MKSTHSPSHTIDNNIRENSAPPSSPTSSVHSTKPLEWDSGADIGYQCKIDSRLSTVERLALRNDQLTGQIESKYDKLVDYSIADESRLVLDENNATSITNTRNLSHSLSMNDLYHLKLNRNYASTSNTSLDKRKMLCKKEQYHSSTSTVTMVQKPDSIVHNVINLPSRKHNIDLSTFVKTNSNIENDKVGERVCSSTSKSEEKRSYENSSQNTPSFEYITGSAYNKHQCSDRDQKSPTDISTVSIRSSTKEVIDGVDLVLEYVNSLPISNKKLLLKKMAEKLMNDAKAESDSSIQSPWSDRLNDTISNSIKQSTFNSATNNESSCKSQPLNSKTSKHEIANSTRISSSSKSYKSLQSTAQTTSSMTIDNYCCSTTENSLKYSSRTTGSSNNVCNLLDDLKKERENQLIWIRSNIYHLKKLKKICEEQNLLKKVKKVDKPEAKEPLAVNTHFSNVDKPRKPIELRSLAPKIVCSKKLTSHESVPKDASRENRFYRNEFEYRSKNKRNHSTLSDRESNSEHSLVEKRPASNSSESSSSVNKENEDAVRRKKNCNRRHHNQKTNFRKPTISYSVFFQKEIAIPNNKKYIVTEHKDKSNNQRKKIDNVLENYFNRDPSLTLKDHLERNRPNFVDRAEYRRHCLAEIVHLRQLREEHREELLTALSGLKSNKNTLPENIQIVPASIPRIFDEKKMKNDTKKKYRNLPEVKNKRQEQKKQLDVNHNQMIAKIFSKCLQKRVLKGHVDLNNRITLVNF